MLVSDEENSVGILRMLDCGGNSAFNDINKKMNDTPHSIDVINQIIVENKEQVRETLKKHEFTDEEIENILEHTHCNAPEDFLITSRDMIGKAGVWAHFGSWDFKKAYLSQEHKKMNKDEIIKKFKDDYDIEDSTTMAWINELESFDGQQDRINMWIAPWPGYISGLDRCQNQGDTLVCVFSQGNNQIPITVDFDNNKAFVSTSDGIMVPTKVAFLEGNSFNLIENTNKTLGIGMVLKKEGDNVYAMFMAPELTGSMFTRLFFFDGIGLNSFEKFYDTTDVYGNKIITWKVIWNKEG